MSGEVKLTGSDGFALSAYRVEAEGERRGGLVLIQEIFGVNANMRALSDGFARDGFEVISPSLFDRVESGFQAGYDAEGIEKGKAAVQASPWETVVPDIQAAIDALERPVFVAGFCWGGSATWIAACRCRGIAAASAFYGRLIPQHLDETPRCPIILHFGEQDHTIPMSEVDKVRAAKPDVPVFAYPDAGHAFFREGCPEHVRAAEALARRRTLQLLANAV